ncbi:hypothetical protein CTA2_6773 [Colletotrichum tanaceti]|uniref:Uncharacterized protein n=1 Tax=Colletotrichum tanaceti TaxID=1306861 RepID=A0A4U6XEK7_9PEZI|nr:hypothetical protein CTA2_6773 [Colletotrichum tanaceti]TKW53612.1 hypothetical protein CTA1_2736 [Colletotrichum tanaceti]
MSVRHKNYASGSNNDALSGQRMFKKHKVLPHPKRHMSDTTGSYEERSTPREYGLIVDSVPRQMDAPQQPSPQTLRHRPKRISSGPDLPPTPPSHSRTSSSSHSVQPPSPTLGGTVSQTPTTPARAPVTPPNQQSPPTPDVTPPQPAIHPKAVRPVPINRTISKATTAESRAESFRTAREEPYSSEEDEMQSTVRPNTLSVRTSQSTVRRASDPRSKSPIPVGLGLGLESPTEDAATPKAKGDFGAFDGDWASTNEVDQEWDDNLGRTATVRKRPQDPTGLPRAGRRYVEIMEDRVITPTNATKALRAMSQRDRAAFYAPSMSAKTIKSARSNPSTVVEAILVDAPSIPQRRQTLRHVRKQLVLRDSGPDRVPLRFERNFQFHIERESSQGDLEERWHSGDYCSRPSIVRQVQQGAIPKINKQSKIQEKCKFELSNSCQWIRRAQFGDPGVRAARAEKPIHPQYIPHWFAHDAPALTLQRATSSETDNGHHHQDHKLNVDRHGDPFFGKRLSTQNTPFSAASVETSGTAPEVSEAKAVSLYPHQNSSVLVVNHSNKPSESSDASQTDKELFQTPQRPTIITTGPDGEGPATPPQAQHTMDDVDSPLRNPRAAPPVPSVLPPAIQFIPATPSGLTPHHERQRNMGNYFETMVDEQPQRSGSIEALAHVQTAKPHCPRTTDFILTGVLLTPIRMMTYGKENWRTSLSARYIGILRSITVHLFREGASVRG